MGSFDEVKMEVKIYYEDTDCGGVVYYANYLRYFERARTDFFEEHNLSVAGLLKEGIQFMVVHAELDYRSPAHYGEILTISTHIEDLKQASMTFRHQIRERESQRLVVEGSARMVAVDLTGKINRLPRSVASTFQAVSNNEEG